MALASTDKPLAADVLTRKQILPRRIWSELAIVLLVTGAALAVRLYRLPAMPLGLFSDEAMNGVDTLNILHGQHAIFFPNSGGREPLFIYLQALAVALLGATPWALRLTSVVIGTLTVPAVYWMVREAFRDSAGRARWLATWIALFLAFSYWHINFSRIGFRAIMLPLMSALAFGWFWRAWHRLEAGDRFPWLDLILCGAFVGAALYTYLAARFLPILVAIVALAGALGPGRSAARTRRIVAALGLIAGVTVLVFLPLGLYFFAHPSDFLAHAAGNAIGQDPAYQGADPLAAFANNALKTAGMFGLTGDPNWRHNPAGRTALEPLLAIWLAGGVLLAVLRRRSLNYLFPLAWLVVFLVPAVMSGEAPHFLRSIGVLPAVYLLVVLAMLSAGDWLAGRLPLAPRRLHLLASWLPLPFLIFSGYSGLHDYFAAFSSPDTAGNLRHASNTRFVDLLPVVLEHDRNQGVWIAPVKPVFSMPEPMGYDFVTGFLSRQQSDLRIVSSPEELTSETKGNRYGYLLTWHDAAPVPDGGYVYADPKNLFAFLLGKYGRPVATKNSGDVSYTTYELPADPDYRVAENKAVADVSFANKIRLTGFDYGHTATSPDEPGNQLEAKEVVSGQNAWVWLRWQAQETLNNDLKASIYLADASGHVAGQSDDPILSDGYLWSSIWRAGQAAETYHIVPTLPALPPGRYDIYVAVYDPANMQRLPVLGASGAPSTSATRLGSVLIKPGDGRTALAPGTALPGSAFARSGLQLLGYDLGERRGDPGSHVPMTLYWRAASRPDADYRARVALRDAAGRSIAEQTLRIGGDDRPTSAWLPGETMRTWYDLAIPPGAPSGDYRLEVTVVSPDGAEEPTELGPFAVSGRQRVFSSPTVPHGVKAQVGDAFDFLGFGVEPSPVQAGGAISVTLYWKARAETGRAYTVFVHLLDAAGQIVGQRDSIPGSGTLPTTGWISGEYVTDSYELPLGKDVAPGRYALEIGMYDAVTGTRLPVSSAAGQLQGDRILLPGAVEIKGK